MRTVFVGVGTNLGAREAAIRGACALLGARKEIAVVEVSTIYETAPLGPPQPDYLNAAYRLETSLSAPELLRLLLRTERRLGRRRDAGTRWGPRSVDLDLLWDEDGPHDGTNLCVPHPELENRAFALAPLLDVAPALRERLGARLEAVGGPPRVWGRDALVRVTRAQSELKIEVESDDVVDGCALALAQLASSERPWSTYHRRVEPGIEQVADLLPDLLRSGFNVHAVTISEASEFGWSLHFHGANTGKRLDADVRLWTTSGANRDLCTHLSLVMRRARK